MVMMKGKSASCDILCKVGENSFVEFQLKALKDPFSMGDEFEHLAVEVNKSIVRLCRTEEGEDEEYEEEEDAERKENDWGFKSVFVMVCASGFDREYNGCLDSQNLTVLCVGEEILEEILGKDNLARFKQ